MPTRRRSATTSATGLPTGDSPLPRGLLGTVVTEIGTRILAGRYACGAQIPTEPELVATLGASRTVVREAVKMLAAKGLLATRPKTGTRVREKRHWNLLDPLVLELYCRTGDFAEFSRGFQQLRQIIEPEAAALAATQHSAAQLAEVAAGHAAMDSARDIDAWTRADLRFHEAILVASGNPFLLPLAAIIRTALQTLLYHSASTSPNPFDSLKEHTAVYVAIRAGSATRARLAMRRLLAGTSLSIATSTRRANARAARPGAR